MTLTTFTLFLLLSLSLSTGHAADLKKFGGVGIDGVPWADGSIVVRQLVTGGPAHIAGIQVGDIITHIDGKQTKGSDFRQMVDYRLRGAEGTRIQINIMRPGEKKPRIYILTRRQLVMPGR